MSSLSSRLNSLNFSTQWEAVKNMLDQVEPKVTFWGQRVIKWKGHSVSLDNVALKVIRAAQKCREEGSLNLRDRMIGIEVIKKLNHFYCITDTQIQSSNCFTRVLNWLRECEFFSISGSLRCSLEGREGNFLVFNPDAARRELGDRAADLVTPAEAPNLRLITEEQIRQFAGVQAN